MDLDNIMKNLESMKESERKSMREKQNKILPSYVSQTTKISKTLKNFDNLRRQVEEQNNIILKHQIILKDCLSMSVYTM